MADLALTLQLEALKSARRTGALRVRFADREVTYRSDTELKAQIAALESELAAAEGTPRPRNVVIRSTKGWG
jgi:hypothetical protein